MSEPSRQTSRRFIAGGALAAIALAAGGFALGRATLDAEPPPAPPEPPVVPLPEAPPPTLPMVTPPLGRAELIAAVSAAADAFAAGRPLPRTLTQLAGRRFELRLPFGCAGAATDPSGALTWRYDTAEEALRLSAAPVRWPAAEWLPAAGPDQEIAVEAIEGFWITRPWTSSESCPGGSPDVQQIAPELTVGIAEFHTKTGSRLGRRNGDTYEEVEKSPSDAFDNVQGFRWRLAGEIGPAPDGRVILCRSSASQARPVCLVSVRLDQVAFENAANGATIAKWDVAGQEGGRASDGASGPAR